MNKTEVSAIDNYFVDPLAGVHRQLLATLIYLIGLPGCIIALCFIWYEGTGNAGPYRTCINQLVSRIYFLVS